MELSLELKLTLWMGTCSKVLDSGKCVRCPFAGQHKTNKDDMICLRDAIYDLGERWAIENAGITLREYWDVMIPVDIENQITQECGDTRTCGDSWTKSNDHCVCEQRGREER